MLPIVTRFAPSPTGFLHVGGARTAIFNHLFARSQGGQFLLRIEDTDSERSTQEAVQQILSSLQWLGLEHDGSIVYQSNRKERHVAVAEELYKNNKAYYCQCSPEKLDVFRKQKMSGELLESWSCPGKCVLHNHTEGALRLRSLQSFTEKESTGLKFHDLIHGLLEQPAREFDDLVLLRSNRTPTYMLAVVVDDYDMGITHIIRGDDHLTNTFRQIRIYQAWNKDHPLFAHIPLLHDSEGKKLSKRRNSVAVEDYRDKGILPEALFNHLLRLGWSYQNKEIISHTEAIHLFSLHNVSKSSSIFDEKHLLFLNHHYIQKLNLQDLVSYLKPLCQDFSYPVTLLEILRPRFDTLRSLGNELKSYMIPQWNEEMIQMIHQHIDLFQDRLIPCFEGIQLWDYDTIASHLKAMLEEYKIPMKTVGPLLRLALFGKKETPDIIKILESMGKEVVLKRLISHLSI